jgi:hypothetical protein
MLTAMSLRATMTRALLAVALFAAGCANRSLTKRTHERAGPCTVRGNGAEIRCAGLPFATLICDTAYDGCMKLVLRYADGDAVLLYESSADPKFYRVDHVTTAADGSRIWFLEAKGLFSPKQTWHVYDVRSGVLRDLEPDAAREVQAALQGTKTVPLRSEPMRQPQKTP